VWTDKSTELLIAGFVGIIGTVVGTVLGWFGDAWRKRRELRLRLKDGLQLYRLAIAHTDTGSAVSTELLQLKSFLLQNNSLLEQPRISEFFNKWLRDPSLDSTYLHSRLSTMGYGKDLAELREDARRCLTP
jgi:hypothetical protein